MGEERLLSGRRWLCTIPASLCIISCIVSLFTIAFIGFNRYLYVCWHDAYDSVFTRRRTVVAVVLIWAAGLALDDGRSRPRLTEPPRLVVALLRRQDSEVSVGLRWRLPLHHPLRRRRNAATVRHHCRLLLAHLGSCSTCQAAASQNAPTGKAR